jgi:glucose/arabinose dehydrogenase
MLAPAIKPGTQALYGVQHDRDMLAANWPQIFTMADEARLLSEEFVRIRQRDDYGWPYCYHDRFQNKKVLAPEYGGNGQVVGRCSSKKLPLRTFPANWAPMSMIFYPKQQFPAHYAGGAFVAFHGDLFTATRPRTDDAGYHVAFVPFVNGAPSGSYEIFASKFVARTQRLPPVRTTGPPASHRDRTARCTSRMTRGGASGG